MSNLNDQARFYSDDFLGFDLRLIRSAFDRYSEFFKGDFCLEVGCSVGHMTKYLKDAFPHVTALDGSSEALDQMRDWPNVVKVHSMIEDYLPKEKYSTIVANHFLEHVSDPVAVLKMMRGMLVAGGVLIVGVPNAKSWHRLAAVKIGLLDSEYQLNGRDEILGHYRVYDRASLHEQVQLAGLSIKAEGGLLMKFLPNSMMIDLSEEVILAYERLSYDYGDNGAEIFVVCTVD